MKVGILQGIYSNSNEINTSYPINLVPVIKATGIDNEYLSASEGILPLFEFERGICRGSFNWNGSLFVVFGNKLINIRADNSYVEIGDVSNDNLPVRFTYSFDRLAIASDNKLYYYNGVNLSQVTDPNLGIVKDVIWIDGYFMTTDGNFIVVTELSNPEAVDPAKYGSAEFDPDPIESLLKVRDEVYAIGRYTIESFNNIGSEGFPFERNRNALVRKGALGPRTSCVYQESIAFLGSALNEPPAIYSSLNSNISKLSTREIDTLLLKYTADELRNSILETRIHLGHAFLYLHLPNQTLVFDGAIQNTDSQKIWFKLSSSLDMNSKYKSRFPCYCYNRWYTFHPDNSKVGELSTITTKHWDESIGYEFRTVFLFGGNKMMKINQLELIALPGKNNLHNGTIWKSHSSDGELYSQEQSISLGQNGNTAKRIRWFNDGIFQLMRIYKFRGNSESMIPFNLLDIVATPLAY